MADRKTIRKRTAVEGKKRAKQKKFVPQEWRSVELTAAEPIGLGPNAAGQSGDIEGLSAVATGDSESVVELVEEGQDLEAENVSALENAPDPDEAEVRTHSVRG